MAVTRRLLSLAGYGIYTLAVLVGLLWFLFPADAVRQRLEYELNRNTDAVVWKIGALRPALPGGLKISEIHISSRRRGTGELVVPSLYLQPDAAAFLRNRKPACTYRAQLLGGSIRGRAEVSGSPRVVKFDGRISDVKIEELGDLLKSLNRSAAGLLSGDFSGRAAVAPATNPSFSLKGKLHVRQGRLSFQEQVLGLNELKFSRAESQFEFSGNVLELKEGILQSTLLSAVFAGTLQTEKSLEQAMVQVNGTLTVRPELFAGIRNGSSGLQKQLKDGKLSFQVRGTLKEPGIFFPDLPTGLEQYLHGGAKKP